MLNCFLRCFRRCFLLSQLSPVCIHCNPSGLPGTPHLSASLSSSDALIILEQRWDQGKAEERLRKGKDGAHQRPKVPISTGSSQRQPNRLAVTPFLAS